MLQDFNSYKSSVGATSDRPRAFNEHPYVYFSIYESCTKPRDSHCFRQPSPVESNVDAWPYCYLQPSIIDPLFQKGRKARRASFLIVLISCAVKIPLAVLQGHCKLDCQSVVGSRLEIGFDLNGKVFTVASLNYLSGRKIIDPSL